MRIRLLSAGCLMVLAAGFMWQALGFAADEPQGALTNAQAPAVADKASSPSDQLNNDNGLVSLDFQDADIKNVLKVLAFKSGLNIVAAPDVTGVVTIQLNNVPWQKALEVILSTYGYGYERKGNIITVMTIENLKKYREDSASLQSQETLISKTFVLSFSKAADVMKVIEKMKSTRGFINFDERTNALIVRDLENNVELISEVIKSIDTITPQVMIETKVIETDVDNTDNLGIDWVLQASMTGASSPTIFPFTQKGFGSGGTSSFFPSNTTFGASNATAPGIGSATAPGFTYGTINASSLSATLQILSSHSNTKILSNPRIVTLDHEKAIFNVGLQYPLPNYTFNAQTGAQELNGFTYKPIGIIFEVTPHVNNAGLITLDLHPQISSMGPLVSLSTGSTSTAPLIIPEINNQETETKVMVEDGKTLVIAGLISDSKVFTRTKVPLLGDIPWLGALFSKNNTEITRKELLIFLTPHIITADKNPAPAAVQ